MVLNKTDWDLFEKENEEEMASFNIVTIKEN
jgi:hypothetical protein